MDKLIEKSNRLLQYTSFIFQRELIHEIEWDWRLVSLIGTRGVGKTTLLLITIVVHDKIMIDINMNLKTSYIGYRNFYAIALYLASVSIIY